MSDDARTPDTTKTTETTRSTGPGGVSRRALFQGVALSAGGIAVLIGSSREAKALMPQKAAMYQTTPKGSQKCANCEHFEPPASCGLVQGPISPNGWCQFYSKK